MLSLKNSVMGWLNTIVDRLLTLPDNGPLVHAVGGGSGLQMSVAAPVTMVAVADTDAEVTSLKTTEPYFFDSRTTELWTNESGTWVKRPYNGDEPFLKPETVCFSRINNRMYYCDGFLRMSPVNLTTGSTPM